MLPSLTFRHSRQDTKNPPAPTKLKRERDKTQQIVERHLSLTPTDLILKDNSSVDDILAKTPGDHS